jgi:hypothetical protein
MDELLLIARQYRRVEREDVIDRRFGIQLPRYLLSLFEHRWVAVAFCYRVD